jgi:hypothetical protein
LLALAIHDNSVEWWEEEALTWNGAVKGLRLVDGAGVAAGGRGLGKLYVMAPGEGGWRGRRVTHPADLFLTVSMCLKTSDFLSPQQEPFLTVDVFKKFRQQAVQRAR